MLSTYNGFILLYNYYILLMNKSVIIIQYNETFVNTIDIKYDYLYQ